MVIVCIGVMNIFAVGVLPWYGKNPIEHDEKIAKEHVPETYSGLLKGARVLLPLSYAINGILAPLLPYVLSGLGVAIFWQTPLVSVWMISRVVMTALLWHFATWHGRWSVLWIAIATMAIGFVGILSATELSMLIIGLVFFGAGMGITYYAALYYAMAVGQAKVDAGGTHEAFIGGGYMVGPIVGLIAIQSSSYAQVTSYQTIIIFVLSLLFLATGALALFWRKAR
jgi:MFS family permease